MGDDVVVLGQSVFWHGHLLGRDDIRVHVVDESPTLAPAFEGRATLVTVPSIRSVDDLTWAAGTLLARGVRPRWIGVGSEMLQTSRGQLAASLGLSSPTPELVTRTRDKRVMKTLTKAAGIPAAEFVSIPHPAEPATAQSVVDRLGLPCVVKPVGGSGSARTYLCHSIAEVAAALDRQQGPAMAESQVVGKEYHVDAVWDGDDPWIFTVSEYGVPPIELGQGRGRVVSMVHDPSRRPDLYSQALELARRVNRALGITGGPTHLEFFETPDGLVFNEVGSRMAGGAFPSLVRVMCGTDLREICTHHARRMPRADLRIGAPRHPVTAMFNIAPPRTYGRITALPDLGKIAAEAHVLHTEISEGVHVGQRIDPGADKGHPWGVLVIVGTSDTASVFELSEDIASRFPITVG
jgi:hypothetical protein